MHPLMVTFSVMASLVLLGFLGTQKERVQASRSQSLLCGDVAGKEGGGGISSALSSLTSIQ